MRTDRLELPAASKNSTAGTLGPEGLQLQLPIQSVGGVTLQLYAQALLVSGAASGGIVSSSAQGIGILAAGL